MKWPYIFCISLIIANVALDAYFDHIVHSHEMVYAGDSADVRRASLDDSTRRELPISPAPKHHMTQDEINQAIAYLYNQ